MKHLAGIAWMAAILAFAPPSGATVQVTFGKHIQRLQHLVDKRYGKGNIDVRHDYEGAHPGDPDPWFWVGGVISARLVVDLSGCGRKSVIGWYEETGQPPAYPGGGIVFPARARKGDVELVPLSHTIKFGFYFVPCPSSEDDEESTGNLLFTNRVFNGPGPDGGGGLHPVAGGPMRALIYDVSRWSQPHTWLVCFQAPVMDEDGGEGGDAALGGLNEDGDDDHADRALDGPVFEVSGLDPSPVRTSSLGSLKTRYRR